MRKLFCAGLMLAVSVVTAFNAFALPIVNGDFSDGLASWTEEYNLGSVAPDTIAPETRTRVDIGRALLQTQGVLSGTIVTSQYQNVTFEGLSYLYFTLQMQRSGPDDIYGSEANGFPDSMTISFWDPATPAENLVVLDTISAQPPINQRFGVNAFSLAGRTGNLYFELFDSDDGYRTTAFLDDVAIGPPPVPEPGTFLLFSLAALPVAILRTRFRKKS